MARLRLGVDIEVVQTGNGFNVALKNVRDLSDDAKSASVSFSGLHAAVIGVTGALGALSSIKFLGNFVKEGLEFNAQMESSRLGLAALIGQFGVVRDRSGNVLHDFNAQLSIAGDLQAKLKVAALQTTAEYGDMVEALQVGLAPALRSGFNTDQIVTFIKTVTQAAGAIDPLLLQSRQLGQEIRGIFEGDISPNSRLANLLFSDIPRDKVRQTVREWERAGTFYQELMKRMEQFSQAGTRASETMAGAISNLKDAFKQALGEGTQGQFSTVTRLVLELTGEIVKFDAQGRATFNADLVNGLNLITQAFVAMGKAVVEVVKALPEIKERADAIRESWQLKTNQWNPFGQNQVHHNIFDVMLGNGGNPSADDILSFRDRQAKGAADYADWLRRSKRAQGIDTDVYTDGRAGIIGPPKPSPFNLSGKKQNDELSDAQKRAAEWAKEQRIQLEAAADAVSHELASAREIVSLGGAQSELLRAQLEARKQIADEQGKLAKFTAEVIAKEHLSDVEKGELIGEAGVVARGRMEIALATLAVQQREIAAREKQHQKELTDEFENAIRQRSEVDLYWTKATIKAKLEYENRFLIAVRDGYTQLAQQIGTSTRNAFASLLSGGQGFRQVLGDFAQSIGRILAETMSKVLDPFFERLRAQASGEQYFDPSANEGQGGFVYPTPTQERNAKIGMGVIQGGAALYGLYTNPAPKQAQNVLSGALSGAAIGAQLTTGPYMWVGAIVGAIVGGIAGLFAPTQKGKDIKIFGSNGQVSITGMDGWGADKLRQEINSQIETTAKAMDAIFYGLPTAVLQAVGGARPDLSKIDVSGKADGTNWNEELDNFLKETLPQRVIAQYLPSVFSALKQLGVSSARINDFAKELQPLKTQEAIQAINDYITVLSGLKDAGDYAAKTFAERVDFAEAKANETPLDQMNALNERIGALAINFDKLTHTEQVDRAKQLVDLTNQRYQLELQYIHQVITAQKNVHDSIDKQITDIQFDQLKADPKQQVDFILDRQRFYRKQLEGAATPEEIQRITGLMQSNASQLYDLLGRTPEAAAQVTSMLQDIQKLADDRFASIMKKIEESSTKMADEVTRILAALREGIEAIVPVTDPGNSGGGGGDDNGGRDPNNPDYINALGNAASGGATVLEGQFTPSVLAATDALLNLPQQLNANVSVNVTLIGTAERLLDQVHASVVADAVTKSVETMERRAMRRRATGR